MDHPTACQDIILCKSMTEQVQGGLGHVPGDVVVTDRVLQRVDGQLFAVDAWKEEVLAVPIPQLQIQNEDLLQRL